MTKVEIKSFERYWRARWDRNVIKEDHKREKHTRKLHGLNCKKEINTNLSNIIIIKHYMG